MTYNQMKYSIVFSLSRVFHVRVAKLILFVDKIIELLEEKNISQNYKEREGRSYPHMTLVVKSSGQIGHIGMIE